MSTIEALAMLAALAVFVAAMEARTVAAIRRAKRAEESATEARLAADAARADEARERRERLRAVSYIQNAATLREPDSLAAEGWLLVDEAREQLDRVAWYLLAKLSPSPPPVCDPELLRHGACLAGWDLGAWLRRADALRAAVNRSPAPRHGTRPPWIDPETGLVVPRFVDADALAGAPPCHETKPTKLNQTNQTKPTKMRKSEIEKQILAIVIAEPHASLETMRKIGFPWARLSPPAHVIVERFREADEAGNNTFPHNIRATLSQDLWPLFDECRDMRDIVTNHLDYWCELYQKADAEEMCRPRGLPDTLVFPAELAAAWNHIDENVDLEPLGATRTVMAASAAVNRFRTLADKSDDIAALRACVGWLADMLTRCLT